MLLKLLIVILWYCSIRQFASSDISHGYNYSTVWKLWQRSTLKWHSNLINARLSLELRKDNRVFKWNRQEIHPTWCVIIGGVLVCVWCVTARCVFWVLSLSSVINIHWQEPTSTNIHTKNRNNIWTAPMCMTKTTLPALLVAVPSRWGGCVLLLDLQLYLTGSLQVGFPRTQ